MNLFPHTSLSLVQVRGLWQNRETYNQLKFVFSFGVRAFCGWRRSICLFSAPFLLISLALPSSSFAKQIVYLKSGFSLEVEACQQQGENTILSTGSGTLQFLTSEIAKVETLTEPAAMEKAAVATPTALLPIAPEQLLISAATAQGVDAAFVRSVAKVESGLRQEAVSHKGAQGLMQLMPTTAARLKVDPTRADDNALGGAKYLRELLLQYHGDAVLALAAYNAGPGAVAKFHGIPPFMETQRYIVLVLQEYKRQLAKQKLSSVKLAQTKRPNAIN